MIPKYAGKSSKTKKERRKEKKARKITLKIKGKSIDFGFNNPMPGKRKGENRRPICNRTRDGKPRRLKFKTTE